MASVHGPVSPIRQPPPLTFRAKRALARRRNVGRAMARAYNSLVICRSNGPAAVFPPTTNLSSRAVKLTDISSWRATLIRKMAGAELLAIPAVRCDVGSGRWEEKPANLVGGRKAVMLRSVHRWEG